MTKHDSVVYLRVMLDIAREVRSLTTGRANENIASHDLLGMAVAGGLVHMGVTAVRVSTDWRNCIPRMDWMEIVDLGRHLIHDYDAIDIDRVIVAVGRLPVMVEALEEALASLPESAPATSTAILPQ
jgi:uncharacterized protein with HEPN domain